MHNYLTVRGDQGLGHVNMARRPLRESQSCPDSNRLNAFGQCIPFAASDFKGILDIRSQMGLLPVILFPPLGESATTQCES